MGYGAGDAMAAPSATMSAVVLAGIDIMHDV
jgi:hypothetical protein